MAGKKKSTVNVSSNSEDWREAVLSTFTLCVFSVDGITMHSAEGGIQAIKFPESSAQREMALLSHGFVAKNYARQAKKKWIWWKGHRYPFNSPFHAKLIERIIRARFIADGKAREALLASIGCAITHITGDPPKKTSLRRRAFCRLLTKMRTELKRTGAISPA